MREHNICSTKYTSKFKINLILPCFSNDAIDIFFNRLQYEDFDTLQCVGSGAFSTVKLVKVKSDRTVGKELCDFSQSKIFALKSMDKEFLEQKGCLNYIQTEKQILSELDHPFIVRFYGEMQDAQTIYFLTEVSELGNCFILTINIIL